MDSGISGINYECITHTDTPPASRKNRHTCTHPHRHTQSPIDTRAHILTDEPTDTCTDAHMHIHTHMWTHGHTHTQSHAETQACTNTCTRKDTLTDALRRTHRHVCTHRETFAHSYGWTHTNRHTCTHRCTKTQAHTKRQKYVHTDRQTHRHMNTHVRGQVQWAVLCWVLAHEAHPYWRQVCSAMYRLVNATWESLLPRICTHAYMT